jgi:O-antigen/teichoic acid export membrane protein
LSNTNFGRNVRWQFAGSAAQAVLGGVLLLLIGRHLSAASFGVFSIVFGYVYVANALFEPRVQDLTARRFWRLQADAPQKQAFADLLVFEVLGKALPCIGLVSAAPLLAGWGGLAPGSAMLIAGAAIGIYVSRLGSGLAVGVLRVYGRSDLNALFASGELLLRLVLVIAFISADGLTVAAWIAIQCTTGFIANTLQLRAAAARLGVDAATWRPWRPAAAWARLGTQRRLILSSLGLSVSDLMNKDLDVTLIAPLVPAEQVGVYKMAKSIVLIAWRAVDPFTLSLMPEVNRLVASGERATLDRLLRRSAFGLLLLAVLLSAGAFALVLLFGPAVLGHSFAGVPAMMPTMFVGVVFGAALVWGHPLCVALDRAELAFAGSLFGSAVGLLAFLALVPLYGLSGAGIAWSLAFLLNFVFTAAAAQWLWRRHHQRPR